MAGAVTASAEEPERRGRKPYRGRFLLVYALLALVLAAAVAAAVVLADRPAEKAARGWSPWKPKGEGMQRASEIADFVGRRYRLPSGAQLVAVRAGPPELQDVPISTIAVRIPRPGGEGRKKDDISVFPGRDSVLYILCGLGDRCSIPEGKPSRERGRLVRRQALELALYTFTYMDGVDSVVAFLPPARGTTATRALFFRRPDLETELDRPVRATLGTRDPQLPTEIDAAEAVMIDRLTGPHEFEYQFQELQDGTLALVLVPPGLEG